MFKKLLIMFGLAGIPLLLPNKKELDAFDEELLEFSEEEAARQQLIRRYEQRVKALKKQLHEAARTRVSDRDYLKNDRRFDSINESSNSKLDGYTPLELVRMGHWDWEDLDNFMQKGSNESLWDYTSDDNTENEDEDDEKAILEIFSMTKHTNKDMNLQEQDEKDQEKEEWEDTFRLKDNTAEDITFDNEEMDYRDELNSVGEERVCEEFDSNTQIYSTGKPAYCPQAFSQIRETKDELEQDLYDLKNGRELTLEEIKSVSSSKNKLTTTPQLPNKR